MREADKLKAKRSYVVIQRSAWAGKPAGPAVAATPWTPGYTAAHKATPSEAIDYEITKAERDIEAAKQRILALTLLKENN